MGGAYFSPGNITASAEFNFYCDPEAADQVLKTPFPEAIAIGLDVSHDVALPRTLWDQIRGSDSPGARLVSTAMADSFRLTDRTGFYIHDALALGVALDPSLVHTRPLSISVLSGFDERGASRPTPLAQVLVADQVESQRFLMAFVTVSNCREPTTDLVCHAQSDRRWSNSLVHYC